MGLKIELPVQPRPQMPKEYTPEDREVVQAVVDIWKADPRTEALGIPKLHTVIKIRHPDWVLSANRVKACLKTADIMPQTQNNHAQQQYAKMIKSKETPDLDIAEVTQGKVKLVTTKAKGKGLHAVRDIKKGTEIWSEKPMVQVIPLELLRIVRQSMACAYCGRPFQMRGEIEHNSHVNRGPPGTTSCLAGCKARYCDVECRTSDIAHSAMWHSTPNSKIQYSDWIKFENYCLEKTWMGAYAYGVIVLTCIRQEGKGKKNNSNKTNSPILRTQFESLATVGHDVMHKATTQGTEVDADGSPAEQAEVQWQTAYKLLAAAVHRIYDLSYEEFLRGVGAYCLNNTDDALFALQSHMNHSCEANAGYQWGARRSEGIKVVAETDIKAGEELTTTYVNSDLDVTEREAHLLRSWGFICGCPRCKRERKELEVVEVDSAGYIKSPPTTERSRRKSVRFDDQMTQVAVK